MAYERFLDREDQPNNSDIRKKIGKEVLPIWEDVIDFLANNFSDYESELIYYNTQHGWALRYRQEAHHLCTLFPERGAFTVLLTLGPEEDELALEKINFFNARIRGLLNRLSTLPQGRWLWVRLEDHTDFVGFKMLLDIKTK